MIITKDKYGIEIVFIENEDGTGISMLKSHYDELEAAKADEAKTK